MKPKHEDVKVIGLVLLGIAAVGVAWFGLWYGLLGYLPAEAWRLTAAIGIGLMPLWLWLTYRSETKRTDARLSGIQDGIDKVISAASKAGDVKVSTAQALRAPARVAVIDGMPATSPAAQYDHLIPTPDQRAVIVSRRPASDGGEIVELG